MNKQLRDEPITPISSESEPLTYEAIALLKENLSESWSVVENRNMYRLDAGYRLASYSDASVLASAIAMLGEENNCYPDISFGRSYVFVTLYSKTLKGLHKNDFIIASKIDDIIGHAKNNESSDGE